ncbi:hypothetical protein ACFQ49_01500 [Kroppenstedtia eburnea]|uniref:Uncharacterized protein n=1 Tax=Kroppenstedtia eburnea TaxID=714067 RepID=A0A1N7KZY2_9BACL|nr:hypothetical protein [Kroppenstedtia eburnea]QKI82727.1 hypothetical protein GXN75_12400 [Kroppenstedtia eburnea]SIS67097.1 hypothetical protein SAMN05421790_103368 [Kroppenstedtia eburnea]
MYPYFQRNMQTPWMSAQTQMMVPEAIKQMMAEHLRLMKEINRRVGMIEEQMRRGKN